MVKWILSVLLCSVTAMAGSNQSLTYQGQITRPDGTAINSGTIPFTVSIYSPGTSKCLLYSENHSVNMTGSEGNFSLQIGQGSRTDGGVHAFGKVFMNGGTISSLSCSDASTSYSSGLTDDRSLEVSFNDGGTVVSFSAISIQSVAYAFQAQEINGYGVNDIVKVHPTTGSPTTLTTAEMTKIRGIGAAACATNEILKWNGTDWVCSSDATGGSPSDAGYTSSNKGIVAFDTNAATSGIAVASGLAKLSNTGVSANTYGSATAVPTIAIDAQGRITSASSTTIALPVGQLTQSGASNGQALKWNGSAWAPAADSGVTSDASYLAKGIVQFDSDAEVSGVSVTSGVAKVNTGVGANQIVKLDGSGKLPAVDGSALTNLPASSLTGTLGGSNGGTGQSSYTTGDMLYASGATSLSKLGIGSSGNVLSSNGSSPTWVTASSLGAFVDGGNTLTAAGSIGTNSNHGLTIKTNSSPRMTIDASGWVGIAVTNPSSALDLGGALNFRGMSAPSLSAAGEGRIYFDSTSNKYKVSQNGSAYVDLVDSTSSVTTVTAGTGLLVGSTVGGSITSTGTLNVNVGTAAGQIVQLDGLAKLPGLDGSALTNLSAGNVASGVLPMLRGGTGESNFSANSMVIANGSGSALTYLTCNVNEIAKWSGTAWDCAADNGFLQDSNANLKAGNLALNSNATGTNHIAIGQESQRNMQTGASNELNISFGFQSLHGSSTVSGNTGQNNFAAGYQALRENSSGSGNTAIGIQTLFNNSVGINNIGIGSWALIYNTTGNHNSAFGWQALASNETGNDNIAIGASALLNSKMSNINIAIGLRAQERMAVDNGSDAGNIAIGREALRGSATPANNTGAWNIAIGDWALQSLTTGAHNVAIGDNPLLNNSTGSENVAIGKNPLQNTTTGNRNIAIGESPLLQNTTGAHNIAIGSAALGSNATGGDQTAVGAFSQELMRSSAGYNTSLGQNALRGSTTVASNTGNLNTAVGAAALYGISSGSFNTAIGNNAGNVGGAVTTGSNNTFLGTSTGLFSSTQRNYATAIGAEARVDADATIVLGRAASDRVVIGANGSGNTTYKFHVTTDATRTAVGGNMAWSTTSDARYKTNVVPIANALKTISNMQGVRFDWDHEKYPAQFPKVRQIGFIAQQVEKHVPEIVHTDENGYKAVQYSQLVAVLTEAVKELHKQFLGETSSIKNKNQVLENEISRLKSQNQELSQRLEALEKKLNP